MSDIRVDLDRLVNRIVLRFYYSFETRGAQTPNQIKTATNRASMTAAEPKSLALLDKSWCSKEIRSIAASTLELRSSTTKTMMIEQIRATFSRMLTFRKRAIGVQIISSVNSCLKALSSLKAYTTPHHEFLAACHALVSPLLPLWGFWSM